MTRDTILGRLAASGWFARNGEIALTSGLAHCLQKDPGAAGGFLELVRRCTASSLPEGLLWKTEDVNDEKGRVDVVGHHATGDSSVPLVCLEAKVGADFADDQLPSYVRAQQRTVASAASQCVLVALVPESRLKAAREEVGRDMVVLGAQASEDHWVVPGPPDCHVAVIAWDAALDVMQAVAGDASADLEQLRGAAQTLRGSDVPSLSEDDLHGNWRDRIDDLPLIIDRVTQNVTRELGSKLAPWQPLASGGLEGGFRYIDLDSSPSLAVGIRADRTSPPLWARWHHVTRDFGSIAERLRSAGKHPVEGEEGHLWMPLDIDPGTGVATAQIDSLTEQVGDLFRITADLPKDDDLNL